MNVVVFGSTGPTGSLVVERALHAGHHVRAFLRTPSKLTLQHERLEVVQGDIYDADSVSHAVEGMEAVVCTVGVPYTLKKVTIYSTASRNIMAAMRAHGVARLIAITAGGTHPGRDPKNPFFFERILKPVFHTLYDDMRRLEEAVMESDLNWTILRPSRLMNRPASGLRVGVDAYANVDGAETSRADLAAFVVTQLTSADLIGKAAAVSN